MNNSRLSSRSGSLPLKLVFSAFIGFILNPAVAGADGMDPDSITPKRHSPTNVVGSDRPRHVPIRKAQSKTGNTTPLGEFDLARYQYCGQDSDCMVAINGCCDCANGGIEVAVNKERLEDFRKNFDCLYVTCGDKPADPPCGTAVVSCISHKCRYFSDALR